MDGWMDGWMGGWSPPIHITFTDEVETKKAAPDRTLHTSDRVVYCVIANTVVAAM